MVVQDAEPVVPVEVHPLLARDELGLVDVLERDRMHQVLSEKRLQSHEHRALELSTARFDVARYVFGAGWVEGIVAVLVVVDVQNDVV